MWKLSEHSAAPRLPGALKLCGIKNDSPFVGQFFMAEYTYLTINEDKKSIYNDTV